MLPVCKQTEPIGAGSGGAVGKTFPLQPEQKKGSRRGAAAGEKKRQPPISSGNLPQIAQIPGDRCRRNRPGQVRRMEHIVGFEGGAPGTAREHRLEDDE